MSVGWQGLVSNIFTIFSKTKKKTVTCTFPELSTLRFVNQWDYGSLIRNQGDIYQLHTTLWQESFINQGDYVMGCILMYQNLSIFRESPAK